MRRLRLWKTLPRVVRRSSRGSIIGAGSPIDAPRGYGAQTFALLQAKETADHRHSLRIDADPLHIAVITIELMRTDR
jgi:hypothetical protein